MLSLLIQEATFKRYEKIKCMFDTMYMHNLCTSLQKGEYSLTLRRIAIPSLRAKRTYDQRFKVLLLHQLHVIYRLLVK